VFARGIHQQWPWLLIQPKMLDEDSEDDFEKYSTKEELAKNTCEVEIDSCDNARDCTLDIAIRFNFRGERVNWKFESIFFV